MAQTLVSPLMPPEKRVIGLNALGVAPSGATPDYFRAKGMRYPPECGVDAMVTPGTPGGLMTMVAEWGRLSLADVLAPAIQMADGYPMEADAVRRVRAEAGMLKSWPYTAAVFFPDGDDGPAEGENLVQRDLAVTLRKLVEAEAQALSAGQTRKEAIYAAYERFYEGDIAEEYVRGVREQGSPVTMADLAGWRVRIEEPVKTTYKGIEVYKLTHWVQGPVLLQALKVTSFDLAVAERVRQRHRQRHRDHAADPARGRRGPTPSREIRRKAGRSDDVVEWPVGPGSAPGHRGVARRPRILVPPA